MVDSRYKEGPGNVAVEDRSADAQLKEWAKRAKADGAHIWMQISHSGRQTPMVVNTKPIAPSPVSFSSALPGVFRAPREMTETEIRATIDRFVLTAFIAKECGWDGVQVHAAHGYLISEFLSPRTNQRNDKWGGSIKNRSRFLREVVTRIRERVGNQFPISVKLNSADFQRNGFTETDATQVVKMLEEIGVDLIEISGGTYEFAAMMQGNNQVAKQSRTEALAANSSSMAPSTLAREAYFIEFAKSLRYAASVPLLLTGGFRSADAMSEAISSGIVDFIGVARPMCLDPFFPSKILTGKLQRLDLVDISVGIKDFDSGLQNLWHQRQIHLMADGKNPDVNLGRVYCLTVLTVLSYIWHPRTAGPLSYITIIVAGLLVVWQIT